MSIDRTPSTDAARLREMPDAQLLAQCRWEAYRASGPGGQKRNKTSSAVRITHEPTGLSAIAHESRSQARNRRVALERLRHRLMVELRAPLDLTNFAPPAWFAALLNSAGRLQLGQRAEGYLAAAGLVLDVLAAAGWRLSVAAGALRLGTGGLMYFIQGDEKLLATINQMRGRAGLKALGA